jgi:hypothetical protein
MFKNHLLHGLSAGILSGVACLVFMKVYKEIAFVDFSLVISIFNIFGACIFGCVLASIGYFSAKKLIPKYGEIVFNLLFTILSFASIIGPIMFTFPPELDIEGIDEITSYFQPFAMTLHFFPALIWYTVKPLFVK